MTKKKTEKPDKPEAQKWLEKIKRAQKVKEEWHERFRVGLCYEYYEGRQVPPSANSEEYFVINKIFSTMQSELPTLYSIDPFYYVKLAKSYSVSPMDVALFEQKGKVRQSMLNYLKKELKLKTKARLSILDAHFAFGVLKTHYHVDMVENPDRGKNIFLDETEIPLLGENGSPLMEPEEIPTNEAYCITRIHPDDFLVDADAGPLEDDVTWKAQRYKMPLEEVRDNKKFNKSARNKVKPTELTDDIEKDKERRKKGLAEDKTDEKEADIVVLWEVYDLKKKQWLTVSEGLEDEFMIDPSPLPGGIEKDPFTDLRFVMRDASWYPIPPMSQWIDSQRENNDLRSKIAIHRRRFNRKYEVWAGAFEDAESAAAKLQVGEDGMFVLKNQPAQAVFPIQDAPLDQNHIMELSFIRGDFEELTLGSNQRGSGSGVDSATEAGIIEKRTQLREGDKIGMVMDFLTETGKKTDQLVQANITQDQAVKVAGLSGEYWELVRSMDYEEIAGEYEYSINTGANTPQLPEIERAQWMAFLGLIAQNPHLALSKALLKKTAEMHHIYDENLVEEVYQIAQAIMSGRLPMPGKTGSQPGVTERNPAAMGPGSASGILNIRGGAQ